METSGITIEHSSSGVPIFAHIDLKKYGDELKDFLVSKGVIIQKSPYNQKFVSKIKESEQQIKNGQFKVIRTEDLWK